MLIEGEVLSGVIIPAKISLLGKRDVWKRQGAFKSGTHLLLTTRMIANKNSRHKEASDVRLNYAT